MVKFINGMSIIDTGWRNKNYLIAFFFIESRSDRDLKSCEVIASINLAFWEKLTFFWKLVSNL